MHSQITISNLSLTVNNKELFSNFSCNIFYGQKIAIIGDNGCGKSVLLKMLSQFEHFPDEIVCGNDLIVGYVPQTISHYQLCSGGERFNKLLSQELAKYPNILLLDEPTNHLDEFNRN